MAPFSVTPMAPTGRLMPGKAPAANSTALVDDVLDRLDPAAGELSDRLRGRRTEHLLVAAEAQPDVLGRREALLLKQPLDALADGDEAGPCRRGPRGPRHRAVDDLGAEGRVLPWGASVVDGDDVEVGQQHHRRVVALPGPVEEQAWVWMRVSSSLAWQAGDLRRQARRRRSRTQRCRRGPGRGRRRWGCGPAPAAWPRPGRRSRRQRSVLQTRRESSSSRPRTWALR